MRKILILLLLCVGFGAGAQQTYKAEEQFLAYTDNFYDVWEHRFQPFRNRSWAQQGNCANCKEWKNCLGNGMHNWHGPSPEVLQCHYSKTTAPAGPPSRGSR